MSEDRKVFAAPGTPGYTGQYKVGRDGVLYAQKPEGSWVSTGRTYDSFPTKGASNGK